TNKNMKAQIRVLTSLAKQKPDFVEPPRSLRWLRHRSHAIQEEMKIRAGIVICERAGETDRLRRVSLDEVAGMKSTTQSQNKAAARIVKSEPEWRAQLTPAQYHVTREHGTERAFTGPFWDEKRAGTYSCVCCGTPLFASDAKFDSGTGWPSFSAPVDGV